LRGGGESDENSLRSSFNSDYSGDLILNYKHQADGQPYDQGDIILNYNPPDEYSLGIPYKNDQGNLALKTLAIRPEVIRLLVAAAIGLACLVFALIMAATAARYVGETALIRMVDDYEETGEKQGLRQGLRMGWSRTAWRLFLIDLLIAVPAALAIILLFLVALAPLLLWTSVSEAAGLVGSVFSVGFILLAVCIVIALGATLSLLKRFFQRACALEDLGVIEAVRRGFAMVRQNLKVVGLMWLIVLGISLAWPIAMIPAVILTLGVAVVLGGMSALLVGGLAGLAVDGAVPWILAGAVGVPTFVLVLVVPLVLLGGLREVFLSSTWTLTYRELRPLTKMERKPLPELGAPGLEATPLAS
jgi:hypothetical protein